LLQKTRTCLHSQIPFPVPKSNNCHNSITKSSCLKIIVSFGIFGTTTPLAQPLPSSSSCVSSAETETPQNFFCGHHSYASPPSPFESNLSGIGVYHERYKCSMDQYKLYSGKNVFHKTWLYRIFYKKYYPIYIRQP